MSPARRPLSSSPAKELRTSAYTAPQGSKKLVYQPSKRTRTSHRKALSSPSHGAEKPSGVKGFFSVVSSILTWFVGVSLITLLVVFAVFWWFFANAQTNLSSDTYLFLNKSGKTESQGPAAIALRIQPNPLELQMIVLKPSVVLNLPGNYGQYPLDSVLPLLKLDDHSPEYTRAVMGLGLGITMDGVIELEKMPTTLSQTTITPQELRQLTWQALTERKGQGVSFTTAAKLAALSWHITANQLHVQEVNTLEEWHAQVAKWPTAQGTDMCSIAVVNTTSTSGVATTLTHVLERSQLTVVKTVDTVPSRDTSQLVIAKPGCEQTLGYLQSIIPTQVEAITDEKIASQYRSDVVLLVGKDVAQFVK